MTLNSNESCPRNKSEANKKYNEKKVTKTATTRNSIECIREIATELMWKEKKIAQHDTRLERASLTLTRLEVVKEHTADTVMSDLNALIKIEMLINISLSLLASYFA